MLNLIKNEYAKVFLKKSTYVILALCLVLSVGIGVLVQYSYDDNEEFYYSDMSFEQEMTYYSEMEYIYEKLHYEMLSLYVDLGYEYYEEIPKWIMDAVDEAIYSHYIYVLVSEAEDVEAAQNEVGVYLDEIDLEYEKTVYEEITAAVKANDYIAYCKAELSQIEYKEENNIAYSEADYIYYTWIIEKNYNPETDKQRLEELLAYAQAKAGYDELLEQRDNGENVTEHDLEKKKKIYTIYQYVLDNDLEHYKTESLNGSSYMDEALPSSNSKFITAITSNAMIAGMAGIFVMIIAAGIIANEFSSGTIKFLLINPIKRAKIFWSKYITCISILLEAMVIFYVLYLVFCMITCGIDGMSGVYLWYEEGVACEESIILYSLKQYAWTVVSLITSVTLAFTISSLMRSNAIAIAISLIIEFLGATITVFLWELGHDWARYLIFANTDLASISQGTSLFPGQTLGFALIVIVIYMVIYLLTAYDAFKKKDV